MLKIFSPDWFAALRAKRPGEIVGVGYVEVAGEVAIANNASNFIPWDSTPPQETEGYEVMTLIYTPKAVGNKLLLSFSGHAVENANICNGMTFAVFDGVSSDALVAGCASPILGNSSLNGGSVSFQKEVLVTSLNPITFKVRFGADNSGAGTMWLNRSYATVLANFGNKLTTSLRVEEIQA